MTALYRNPFVLPTLLLGALLAVMLAACKQAPPPRTAADPAPSVYLEALQEAEALRHSLEERKLEQARIDSLIGRGQGQPPTR